MNLELDPESRFPIYVQISDAIRQRIIEGQFPPEFLLPSSRNLALEIGVSRTSIVAAYDQLKAEGYLVSKRGSGVRVGFITNLEIIDRDEIHTGYPTAHSAGGAKRSDKHPSFADMRLFPYRQWAKCLTRVARRNPQALVSAGDTFGDMELRKSITRYLRDWRGVNASPEQILITAGSIDALELCIRTLLLAKDSIGLENPGYLPLRNYVKQLKLKTSWMSVDGEGARIPLGKNVRVVVITPSHQFPLGGAMSPGRRTEFIAWSETSKGWIIEDDYDSEFRYAGRPIPALVSLDNLNRSIYVGSFAKIFSTGLRLGFLVIPIVLIDQFRTALRKYATKASVSMQRPLSEFMNDGEFYRHIRRVRRIYAERRELLLSCLNTELGEIISYDNHHAGMQLAVKLPEGFDDSRISEAANEKGVNVIPLSTHYHGNKGVRGLLMGFCAYQPDEIKHNVSLLKSVMHDYDV